MKYIPLFLLCAVCAFAETTQTSTNTVKFAWDWPFTGYYDLTNYSFNIHSSPSATAPLPWPVTTQVFGMTQAVTQVTLTANSTFFYVTAVDNRASPTNYVAESLPSNAVQASLVPHGSVFTIGKAP